MHGSRTLTVKASGGVTFRRAVPDDVDAALALIESAYRGESSRAGWTTEADLIDGTRTDAGTLRAMVESSTRLLLLGFDSVGSLVACCQLERRGEATYFGMFAVRPTLQGRGIGDVVLAEAERVARDEWRATRMEMSVIDVRDELIAWYERRGYRRTGEIHPFPYAEAPDSRPRRPDLQFAVLAKEL